MLSYILLLVLKVMHLICEWSHTCFLDFQCGYLQLASMYLRLILQCPFKIFKKAYSYEHNGIDLLYCWSELFAISATTFCLVLYFQAEMKRLCAVCFLEQKFYVFSYTSICTEVQTIFVSFKQNDERTIYAWTPEEKSFNIHFKYFQRNYHTINISFKIPLNYYDRAWQTHTDTVDWLASAGLMKSSSSDWLRFSIFRATCCAFRRQVAVCISPAPSIGSDFSLRSWCTVTIWRASLTLFSNAWPNIC